MRVVWNPAEVDSPTPVGDGPGSATTQENFVLLGDGTKAKFPMKDAVVQVHCHRDGRLLNVMKTIVNAGRIEIHVDV